MSANFDYKGLLEKYMLWVLETSDGPYVPLRDEISIELLTDEEFAEIKRIERALEFGTRASSEDER